MGRSSKNYITVDNKEVLKDLYNTIQENEIHAIDTETNSLNVRKGEIIGWSLCAEPGKSFYLPTKVWNVETETLDLLYIDGTPSDDISKKLLKMLAGKKLVFHNASFDARYIRNYYGVDLVDSVWVDTGMLVHTVNEEGAFGYGNPFALKSIAKMHQEEIGLSVEEEANKEQIELKESVKINGGSIVKTNFEIYKADLDVLCRYGAADTDLTLRICYLYLLKLKEDGLWDYFFDDEVMPIYREVTIPMEDRGVHVDLDLLHKVQKEISEDMNGIKEDVISSILSWEKEVELEDGTETRTVKGWILQKAVEEYPANHKGKWAKAFIDKHNLPLEKLPSGNYALNKKAISKLEESVHKDFLLTGNANLISAKEITQVSLGLWKIENEGRYFNINSKKQLCDLVFGYMGIDPISKTEKGAPQFNEETVEALSDELKWAKKLRKYNKLNKIKSTYIDKFITENEDGIYYPYYKQNGTVSGRYGSNFQQLPKPKEDDEDDSLIVHYNNYIRAFLIAGEGRKFIDDDYSSLEPRIFASVTGDAGLKEIFSKGWDFYSTIAIRTENLDRDKVNYPNGVSPDTKSEVFLKNLDPVKRQKSKSYSLGLAYGLTSYALHKTLKISKEEAQTLYDGYLNGFPMLKEWIKATHKFVKANGYIKNKVGRKRHLPRVKEIYEIFGDDLLDYKKRKALVEDYGEFKVMNAYRDYKNGINNSLNYQIQSMAASVVNRAALQVNRKAKELGIDAWVCAQIHDQLVINISEENAEMFAPIVQELMENTTKLDDVDLIAEPEISDNLRDGH